MAVTAIQRHESGVMFPVDLPRGLPLAYRPPEHIMAQLMAVMPLDMAGRPSANALRLWSAGVAYTYEGGLWNAQALVEGTDTRN